MATPAAQLNILIDVNSTMASAKLAKVNSQLKTTGTTATTSSRHIEKHSKSLGKLTGGLKSAAAAGGSFIAAYVGFSVVTGAIKFTEELAHQTEILSAATGMSAKTSSRWIELAKQRHVSTTQLTVGFKTLSKQIRGAEQGSTAASKAFHALGIPLKDLQHMTTQQTLLKVSDALKGMKGGAEKTALTAQLFGKSALNLLPILDKGSKGIQNQLSKFNGLSEAQLKQAKEAMEMQRKVSRAYDELKIKVAFALLAATKSVAKWVNDIIHARGAIGKAIHDIANFLGPILKEIFKGAEAFFKGFAQVVKGVSEVISGILHGNFSKAWKGIKDIFSGGIKAILGMLRAITAPLRNIIGHIGDILAKGFESVWDKVTSVFSSAVSTIAGFIQDIADVINPLLDALGVGEIHITGSSGGGKHAKGGPKTADTGKRGVKKARGGPINMGAAQGDTVPAMLERGEYVLNKKAVSAVGKGQLDALNFDMAPRYSIGSIVDTVGGAALGAPLGPLGIAAGALLGSGTLNAGSFIDALPKPPKLPGVLGSIGGNILDMVGDKISSLPKSVWEFITGGGDKTYSAIVKEANRMDSLHQPYLWGGGHGATASKMGPWDCSGAVSELFNATGWDFPPMVSSGFSGFGSSGAGRVSVLSNPEHVYAVIGNRAWGTSEENPGGGAGWIDGYTYRPGFTVTHADLAESANFRKRPRGGKRGKGEKQKKGFQAGGFIPGYASGGVVGTAAGVMKRNGMTANAIAGILGNAFGESSWNPASMEPGTHNGGLWGFTASPVSLSDLENYAASQHKPWTDVTTQTQFMLKHLPGGLKGSLNKAGSVGAATSLFMHEWERPASYASLPTRIAAGEKALKMLGGVKGVRGLGKAGKAGKAAPKKVTGAAGLGRNRPALGGFNPLPGGMGKGGKGKSPKVVSGSGAEVEVDNGPAELAAALEENAAAIRAQTAFATSAVGTSSAVAWKALADILGGQLGGSAQQRRGLAGTGSIGTQGRL